MTQEERVQKHDDREDLKSHTEILEAIPEFKITPDGRPKTYDGKPLSILSVLVFASLARQGWPIAVRRAIEADKEAANLRERLHQLEIDVAAILRRRGYRVLGGCARPKPDETMRAETVKAEANRSTGQGRNMEARS